MPALVKIPSDVEPGEWAMVELQGELHSRQQGNTSSQFIGDLHYTNEGVPILIIGHHILYGKETALTNPFAVLERHRSGNPIGSQSSQSLSQQGDTEYRVKAIVRKKLLFKTRPKPIIANIPQTLSATGLVGMVLVHTIGPHVIPKILVVPLPEKYILSSDGVHLQTFTSNMIEVGCSPVGEKLICGVENLSNCSTYLCHL